MIKTSSNINEFSNQLKRDFETFKKSKIEGVNAMMLHGLNQAKATGFTSPHPAEPSKTNPKLKFYPQFAGANLKNRKGKAVYQSGQIVPRKGGLQDDLDNLSESGNSKFKLKTVSNGKDIIATCEVNSRSWGILEYGQGKSGSIVTLDGTKPMDKRVGQRQIIKRGFALTSKLWNKIVAGKIDKYLKRLGDR